jgi:hypothetical protein
MARGYCNECGHAISTCRAMEWGQYISLHRMRANYRYGWQDKPRDMKGMD